MTNIGTYEIQLLAADTYEPVGPLVAAGFRRTLRGTDVQGSYVNHVEIRILYGGKRDVDVAAFRVWKCGRVMRDVRLTYPLRLYRGCDVRFRAGDIYFEDVMFASPAYEWEGVCI